MGWLSAGLVGSRVVGLDPRTSSTHDQQHELEELEDSVAFDDCVLLDELLSEGGFDLFEDLGAEDELDGGVGDGEDVLF